MAVRSSGGVSRVLAKLSLSLDNGNYYEAHQMYRTLYYRYSTQKKYDEVITLLYDGSTKLLEFNQKSSATDLAVLLVDSLDKVENLDKEKWVRNLAGLMRKIGPIVERETFLAKSVKWAALSGTETLKHLMHQQIAAILWDEGNLEQARHHFILSKDSGQFAKFLIELSGQGYAKEVDLFIANTVLQQLCMKDGKTSANQTFETYTKYHPKIATTQPPFSLPLLNFIYFLLKAIDTGKNLAMFKALCELYKPSIDRDPAYQKYLEKVGVLFFNAPVARQGPQGGIFGDLINQLFQGLDEGASHEDDDEGDDDRLD
ncbi:Golgi to ER traffic protein 4 homolog [Culicoides brevitarsis]|uniref:Golgi to ER traffic protein 4 homolog n=1 Tax=Culicoides brevitarsis TaxID=469753 RepID=UPI00307CBEF8